MIQIKINLKALEDENISLRAFMFMYFASIDYIEAEENFPLQSDEIRYLVKTNYILDLGNNLFRVTGKFKTLIPPEITTDTLHQLLNKDDLEDFVEEYRNIFPSGISSGGYLVRGDKKGCLKKLQKFLQTYPEFTKETILTATRKYVGEMRLKGYLYMKLAHYFIEKDGVSTLAAYCETLISGKNNKNTDTDFFETSLN